MSSSSLYGSVDSEDDTTSWLVSSEDPMEDKDELTLLNGDEQYDENSSSFEDFLRLSMRLKRQYNLREASVALERCDKIWYTMQLLKRAQSSYSVTEERDDTDDENEQDDWAKSSHRTSDFVSSSMTTGAVSYIKYEPTQGNGNNALPNFYLSVKKQTKIYNCGTCGKIYNEKRAFSIHLKRDHGIGAVSDGAQESKPLNNPETRLARPWTPQSTDTSSVDGDKASRPRSIKARRLSDVQYACPVCTNVYTYKGSLRSHAKEVHGLDVSADAMERAMIKKEPQKWEPTATTNKTTSVKCEEKRRRKTERTEISYVYTNTQTNNTEGYLFFCITCHKEFCERRGFRIHSMKSHRIKIPKGPEGSLSGLFIKDVESAREYLRRLRPDKNPKVPPKTERAGPLSSKTSNRPKRACTVNTSYTETTKEEEEILECNEFLGDMKKQSPSSRHTTKCFLCQSSCADMARHLRDYHRISKPDSVLPLNEQLARDPIHKVNYDEPKKIEAKKKSEQTEFSDEPKSSKRHSKTSKDFEDWHLLGKQINGLYRKLSNKLTRNEKFQCLLCKFKYSTLWGLKVHLASNMENGVVEMHEPPRSGRAGAAWKSLNKGKTKIEKAVEDPLNVDAGSIVDSESSSTKRRPSYSDPSSSMGEVMPFKRRKIELKKASESIDKSRTSGSEESEGENREEKATRQSEKNGRYDRVDETVTEDSGTDKSPDQRDTRESSDRDSGIGISITIKKRNNSYEVVERDNCEGDKVKDEEDEEVSKDENVVSSDSSSDITTNSDHRNGHELAGDFRTREQFDPLDDSRQLSDNKATRNQDDDDITILECTVSRTTDQMNKQNVRSSLKASTEILGNVPSLKFLCRNLLKRRPVSCFTQNHVNSHQCPVCCRFYAMERDVTVHMIEHRVSRATFRCAGMLAIPRAALRRYGRRQTFE